MDMLRADWLPLRFWLAALGGTSILLVSLLAVGAIDDRPTEDILSAGTHVSALLQDADGARCKAP